MGKHIKLLNNRTCSYYNSKNTLEAAGLLTIEEYINKRKNMVRKYVKNTTIYKDCAQTIPSPGYSSQIVWGEEVKMEENKNVIKHP
jgi:hypothetical protein